jgi:cytochrome bd-type quinol oxidase subunit 2
MVVALVGIVAALGAAGLAMLRRESPGQPRSHRMMQALALRVALSVALFVAVLVAYLLGWIQPTGLPR